MPVNVFGDRVNDNVCAMVERVLNVGTEEGIIDHDHDAISVGHSGDVPNVNQAQRRIARAFDPYQLGFVRADEPGHVDFDAGRESNLNAMGCSNLGEVAMRTAVDVGNRHNVRALRERLENQGGGGRAGGKGEGEAGMFQRSDCLFEIISARCKQKSDDWTVATGNHQGERPIWVGASGVLIFPYWFANAGLGESGR